MLTNIRSKWTETDNRLRHFDYRHHIARTHAEGDRSGKLLEWLIKNERRNTPIGAIRLESGRIVNIQSEINNAFKEYYSSLYQARPPPTNAHLSSFFSGVTLSHLTAAQTTELDSPIEIAEIQRALLQLTHG
ncbi:hypothetical protein NDU88_005788 [Pleurodeles waltl]|uniref:Uncharacterized protein n=1 Tax=Pleurodeles waltl TaxID=8319 RepID=A0AAV7MZ10_PLEWA|nr:hypothetical protein NDU88_005788 [Pleurodeles waltl]